MEDCMDGIKSKNNRKNDVRKYLLNIYTKRYGTPPRKSRLQDTP